MSSADTAQLRRAAYLLLVVSVGRAAWDASLRSRVPEGVDVLPELLDAAAARSEVIDRAREPLSDGDLIDPNGADAIELDRLPGVGPSVAAAIVSARESGAVFTAPADLMLVPGIGSSTVQKIAPWLDFTARGPRLPRSQRPRPSSAETVEVNSASEDELVRLPGIGPALARRIVEARPFSSVEDLQRVRGVGPATIERLKPFVRVGGRRGAASAR